MSDSPQNLLPPTYGPIHRAVLAGLLSNVGQRTEGPEYVAPRGQKFYIFPGSTLFKKKPPWVMSAEMVQTTRLYARTVASIQPQWIERVAAHLVQRTYEQVRFDQESGHVVADEKVTLWGTAIIPSRTIRYGEIDPEHARRVFIQEALVEQRFRTHAPFAQHNRQLVADVLKLQAKVRRADLLAGDDNRYAFFESRIPRGIYNTHRFEQWRRQQEKRQSRHLFMSISDLLRPGVPQVSNDQFPDTLVMDDLRLPLRYRLEPGHAEDGITVTIPLEVLNRLEPNRFEWLVPGLLLEKITAIIRHLPKPLRVSFVPVPEVARRVVENLRFGEGSFAEALAWELGRIAGTTIPQETLPVSAVPQHLRMNFRVVDAGGKRLAQGRDLWKIREQLAEQVRRRFEALPASQWNRDGITHWDFGDLPPQVQVQDRGTTLVAYPSVVDRGDSVALRLFDSPGAAEAHLHGGVVRLFMLQMPQELKYAVRSIPDLEQLSLRYATLGGGEALRNDLSAGIADRAFVGDRGLVRTAMEFELRLDWAWNRLNPAALELGQLVGRILSEYQSLAVTMSNPHPPLWREALEDLREQLRALLAPGFIAHTPPTWLVHFPRYVKAMQIRLHRLGNFGYTRDAQQMAILKPLWERYKARAAIHRGHNIVDPKLQEFRWMLEELRVSLFAPDLKTFTPVSLKKLQELWAKVS